MFKVNSESGSGVAAYALTLFLALVVLVAGLALWGFAADCTKQDGPAEAGTEIIESAIDTDSIDEAVEEVVAEMQASCEHNCRLAFGPGGKLENAHTCEKCLEMCRD